MKLKDVVTQIQLILPKYTTLLSDSLTISDIVASSGTATITSALHNLTTNDPITITNVSVKTPIDSVSQSGNLFTFTTTTPHDLTFGWHETVTLQGFTDSAWNDTALTLIAVSDRNTFTVRSVNTIPTLNTNEILFENRVDGVNGRYQVTVVNSSTFTISGSFIDGDYSGGSIDENVRVAGAVTIERAMEQYTEQRVADLWAFVVMDDVDVSKDRNAFNDATATKTASDDIRMKLIDGFSVTFVANTTEQIAAVTALDNCRHDLLLPILKTVYGARFDTGLTGSADYVVVPTGAGVASYDKAILAYTYTFESVFETTIDDGVEESDNRAFRDIDYTESIGETDTTDMTILPIKLDT